MAGFEEYSFQFFKMPKILFSPNSKYKSLSTDAKLLYGLMLDRTSLSKSNGWYDENSRIYIIYSIDTIRETLGCGKNKAIKILKELETAELIERIHRRKNLPDLIYVNNIDECADTIVDDERKCDPIDDTAEIDTADIGIDSGECEVSKEHSGGFKNKPPEVLKVNPNKTNFNKTNFNNSFDRDMNDANLRIYTIKSRIKEQISYNDLLRSAGAFARNKLDEIIESIMDIYMIQSEDTYITVSGRKYPAYYVKYRYSLLDYDKMQYVLECMKNNTSKIKNIKNYITTVLFNAVSTCDWYYECEVNSDMQSDKFTDFFCEYQKRTGVA